MGVPDVPDHLEHVLDVGHVAQPLAHDDVRLLVEHQVVAVALEHLDPVLHAVVLDELPGEPGHARALHGDHAPRAGLGGQDGQQARARSDVDDQVPGLDHLGDGAGERGGPRLVGDHPALLLQAGVVHEVLFHEGTEGEGAAT